MYELKVPQLKRSSDVANAVIDGIFAGTLDVKAANAATNAAGLLTRNVSTDLKRRMETPALIESEAKLIEQKPKEDAK